MIGTMLIMTMFLRVLIRPHPAIWRLVHGMAVVYLVALTFLLFQVCVFYLSIRMIVKHLCFDFVLLFSALILVIESNKIKFEPECNILNSVR